MDKRPDPKPRMNILVWQYYQWMSRFEKMRLGTGQRLNTIEKGKSNMDPGVELAMMADLKIEIHTKDLKEQLIEAASEVGPIWEWATGWRGLGAGFLVAKIIALVDYPAPFPGCIPPDHMENISKLWCFSGLAVVNGKAEVGTTRYCRKLKATLLGPKGVAEQFVTKRTPYYSDLLNSYKLEVTRKHPEPFCSECRELAYKKPVKGDREYTWTCPNTCKIKAANGKMIKAPIQWSPLHIHRMSKRYAVKRFMAHFWMKWREYEGIPLTDPWIATQGNGIHTIEPPPNPWDYDY